MSEERVQKLIAKSGMCSRREADEMVREGRVTINGQVAQLGAKADPEFDHVKIDGKKLRSQQVKRYLLLYKPRAVMTTCDDPEGRKTVIDIVQKVIPERVFPVGRLDYHSEGLILLTNDGDLASRVTHPKFGVIREYLVKIRGDLSGGELKRLMAGIELEGQRVKPKQATRVRVARDGSFSWWRIEVTEGRTHEVRELFFRAGHHVQRLRRTAIGPLRDKSLKPGDFRDLTAKEINFFASSQKRAKTGRAKPKSYPKKAPKSAQKKG